jgi:hypothetical protein
MTEMEKEKKNIFPKNKPQYNVEGEEGFSGDQLVRGVLVRAIFLDLPGHHGLHVLCPELVQAQSEHRQLQTVLLLHLLSLLESGGGCSPLSSLSGLCLCYCRVLDVLQYFAAGRECLAK